MTGYDFKKWLSSVNKALRDMKKQDFGYSLGTNEVQEISSSRDILLPKDLEPFYSVIDKISLPDVYNGYFIDPPARIANASERGEPTRVRFERDKEDMPVQIFGGDGGGGRFALSLQDGVVYYLPSFATVEEGIFFEDDDAIVKRIASNMSDFLERLKIDIEAFVYNKKDHKFMIP